MESLCVSTDEIWNQSDAKFIFANRYSDSISHLIGLSLNLWTDNIILNEEITNETVTNSKDKYSFHKICGYEHFSLIKAA